MCKHKIVNALPLTHRQKTHLPGTHKLFRAIMKEFSNGNVTFAKRSIKENKSKSSALVKPKTLTGSKHSTNRTLFT
jgi:hypothetical protein